MVGAIPFVPTPRLDYTRIYNETKDDYRYYLEQQQRQIQRNENLRLEQHHEQQRIMEKKMLIQELQDVKMYEALSKQQAYRDYKYAYYVGTLIDQYI